MSDSVSLIVAVVILFLVFRWVLGSNATSSSNGASRGGGPTNPRRRNVTPDMVEAVKNLFPEVPTAAIQADLAVTGSVEVTCNKILTQGGLPMPSHILPRVPPQDQGTTASTTATDVSTAANQTDANLTQRNQPSDPSSSQNSANLLERYQLDATSSLNSNNTDNLNSQTSVAAEEPPKVWSQDAESRQQTLMERKKFMILEARRKMLEKQQKANETSTEATPAEGSSTS